MFDLTFTVIDTRSAATPLTLAIDQAVIAGWTGRDPLARNSAHNVTQAPRLDVLGPDTSGEVEPVIVALAGRLCLTIGSDHTDRKVESYSVTVSKQMCDKPLASVLWELEDVIDHWDRMILRSFAVTAGKRELYQEGTLDAMLSVEELIKRGFVDGRLPDGCVMFGGTFAAKGGIRPADRFEYELEDPVLKRRIRHAYDVIAMPIGA